LYSRNGEWGKQATPITNTASYIAWKLYCFAVTSAPISALPWKTEEGKESTEGTELCTQQQ
jgi:hypothetical protein